ncbi:hypothetical protein P3T76_014213 [Phytophthora citrophthora]|uniref:HAT C-terminal dimerisation domain-containing protein n=1 Tax=Phytophthora citrophthora TaxID=4793 RepID=A0AAD9G298_9STRA|nr:hypothetical protein P3T76_014213 [Phytophthora citrophthora]
MIWSNASAKRQKRTSDYFQSVEQQASFERDFLEIQSECGFPDLFVERGSAKQLFSRIPHFELSSRKELGGRIFQTHTQRQPKMNLKRVCMKNKTKQEEELISRASSFALDVSCSSNYFRLDGTITQSPRPCQWKGCLSEQQSRGGILGVVLRMTRVNAPVLGIVFKAVTKQAASVTAAMNSSARREIWWTLNVSFGRCPRRRFVCKKMRTGVLQPDVAIQFWVHVADSWYGKNSKLPQLAKVLLSVTVSTVTCRQYFSELGIIHTSKRNRLKFEKVRNRNREKLDGEMEKREKDPVDPAKRAEVRVPSVSESLASFC